MTPIAPLDGLADKKLSPRLAARTLRADALAGRQKRFDTWKIGAYAPFDSVADITDQLLLEPPS